MSTLGVSCAMYIMSVILITSWPELNDQRLKIESDPFVKSIKRDPSTWSINSVFLAISHDILRFNDFNSGKQWKLLKIKVCHSYFTFMIMWLWQTVLSNLNVIWNITHCKCYWSSELEQHLTNNGFDRAFMTNSSVNVEFNTKIHVPYGEIY